MYKKSILFFILLTGFIYAEKAAILRDIKNPSHISLGNQHLYVIEKTSIYVYSLKDYSLISKFGKAGEGPKEFRGTPTILIREDHLMINSTGKVSFFSKSGKFIKELKTPLANSKFYPIIKGFIGTSRVFDNNISYLTVNLYDEELIKRNEIYRIEDFQQARIMRISFPFKEPMYSTTDSKIIIAGKPGFVIDILDHEGKLLYSIENKEFKKRKFTSSDEQMFRILLKKRFKERYERYKRYLVFRNYYPAILDLFTDRDKIYVFTWRIENKKIEIFEYDLKSGKVNPFPKVYKVKIAWQTMLKPYPMEIKNNKIYQLIENQNEEWELHISAINN